MMKTTLLVLSVSLLSLPLLAQDGILVEAKIIESPAGLKLTRANCESAAFVKKKGLKILSAPRLQTSSGIPATVFVGQSIPVRSPDDGTLKQLPQGEGVQMKILPKLEGDKIKYAGSVTVRKLEHAGVNAGCEETEFSTCEHYFAGECRDGDSVLVNSRGIHGERTITVCLAFKGLPDR